MKLGGQGASSGRGQRGFAMAALLVGMSVMAILMGAALPVWNRQAQREREKEYLFRANEYARAVLKFRSRVANAIPPDFDVLVQQRFLRRKYKDPLTGEDFQPVYQTVTAPGQPAGGGAATPGTITRSPGGTPTAGQGTPVPGAGVIGVVSKSKATSIKIYNGRTTYDQWSVTWQDVKLGRGLPPDLLQAVNAAGRPAAGGQPAGGFGQPGGGPGQPGRPGQPGANPSGQPGQLPFGQPPGQSPFGQPGQQPAGQPGTNPFGQPSAPSPFGQPGQQPFGQPSGQPPQQPGGSIFTPAYPPLPDGTFGAPPRRPPGR